MNHLSPQQIQSKATANWFYLDNDAIDYCLNESNLAVFVLCPLCYL